MKHFKRGVLLTLIGGTCWGFSGASGQFLFTHYQANPMWLTSMRMCFAGLLITLFGALTQKEAMKRLVSQEKDLLKTFGFGFVLMLCQFTYLQAINTSNAGTATVLQYLSPIYIMIFVCLTSKRLPNKIEALCIVLALGGAFVIATHGRLNGLALTPIGLFWGIFCGFTAAAYSIYPKRLMAVYGSVPVTGIGMFFWWYCAIMCRQDMDSCTCIRLSWSTCDNGYYSHWHSSCLYIVFTGSCRYWISQSKYDCKY